MDDNTTQSVDYLRSHAERGNEECEAQPHEPRGAFWPLMALIVIAGATLLVLQLRHPPQRFEGQDPELLQLIGRELPNLETDGWLNTSGPLSADDLRGQVVLVDFWATSCGPCLRHTPELVEIQKRFRDSGFTIVGLTPEAGPAADRVKQYVESVDGMNWPIGYGANSAFQSLGVRLTPTYVLYSRKGRSIWGGHSLEGLEEAAIRAIAKK